MAVSPSLRLGLALVVLLVLAAGLWFEGALAPPSPTDTRPVTKAPMLPAPSPLPKSDEHPTSQRVEVVAQSADFATLYRSAISYRQFIEQALPAAKSGDPEAQYYVAAALGYCDETFRLYFKRRDKVLGVEEAIAAQTNRGSYQYIDGLKLAAARCTGVHGRIDPPWGSADEWLAKASQAGQPVALFRKAIRIWLDMETNKAPTFSRPDGSSYTLDDARTMVRAAARSADPQVLFELGDMRLLMKPDDESEERGDSMVWRYVACLRGLDCRPESEWHRQFCTFDPDCRPGEPGMEYLRRLALQGGLFDLELRASLINEKIDAGDWAALGLGE